jgi:hypothetical protein
MHFDMKSPCNNCPFRTDVVPYINRSAEIAAALEHKTFECHKTVFADQLRDAQGRFIKKHHSHCAGALIIMEKMQWWGDMQQIAFRLGLYDPKGMNLDAPVYDSFEEWVAAHEENRPTCPRR